MLELLKVFIYYPFLNVLAGITAYVPGHNVVWGIVGLTLLVRFILLIPSKRAAQAQRKLFQLQPMMEELKAEYGSDKQGLALAQMELYKQNDINPLASCVPALIQLPILLILYRAIINGVGVNTPHVYSWIPRPEHIQDTFLGLNLLQPDHLYILPVIAAVLQYFQIKMTLPPRQVRPAGSEPDATEMMQRQSVILMPAVTLFIASRFPAGVAIYWIVSTVFTIVQQYYVNQENLRLKGVEKALEEGDKKHPENHTKFEQVKKVVEQSDKKGVQVTVRKKS